MALWIAIGAGGYALILAFVLGLCRAGKRADGQAVKQYLRWRATTTHRHAA